MNTKNFYALFGFLLLVLVFNGCSKDEDVVVVAPAADLADTSAEIALEWNQLFLEVERYTPGYRPPVSARTAAYIGLTAYETLMPALKDRYRSVIPQMTTIDLPTVDESLEYNWQIALNASYKRIFDLFFESAPTRQQFDIAVLASDMDNKLDALASIEVKQRSRDYGYAMAEAIYEWAKTDELGHNSHERNVDPNFTAPQGPGLWQPTYPDFSEALTPYWGDTRTFAANKDVTCDPPLVYSESPSSQIYAQALEIKSIVDDIKQGERYEDRWIADFWSDDCPILTFTPAARWISVGNQVIEQTNSDLGKAVYVYAKLGIALSDAGARAWDEKYRFNLLRPIDYIRDVMGDRDWNSVMCPDGSGRFFTPNFPAYPSGHATFGAAAAEVLAETYGINFRMTDNSHLGRTEFIGTPRTFESFFEMAEENAYSRIPIGVHFRMDSEAGLDLGRKVGRRVNAMDWHL